MFGQKQECVCEEIIFSKIAGTCTMTFSYYPMFIFSVRQAMTKKQKDQQEAIWELLSTEAAYIAKLHVIKKVWFSICAVCLLFYFI